jgi:hypothetical protein
MVAVPYAQLLTTPGIDFRLRMAFDAKRGSGAPVPVALFVYRRAEQLDRTLSCLRAAGIEKLYVFSDGPKDAAAAEGVAMVRELVAAIDWIEPVTFARTENLGLSGSIRSGLDSMFETHARAIVIEDDICIAPEFHDFACQALERYEASDRVAGVTGLRLPFDRRGLEGYPYDVFLSPRFSSWGWATWRDRWRSFSFDKEALRGRIAAAGAAFRPERAGADMAGMVHEAVVAQTLTGSWDVVCAANMLLDGRYFVTPMWNMVENTGLSDGAHFSAPPPWQLRWESDRPPAGGRIRFAPVEESDQVLREYRRFFTPNRRTLARARLHALLTGRAR